MNLTKLQEKFVQRSQAMPLASGDGTDCDLNIHGAPLSLRVADTDLLRKIEAFFPQPWFVKGGNPSETLALEWLSPQEFFSFDVPDWGNTASPECFFFQNFVFQRDFWLHKVESRSWRLVCNPAMDDGFFNFLRFYLPQTLLAQEKVLFHTSCIANGDGDAFLFFGFSGAGKTTITTLCEPEALVLGDDMCVLSVDGGQIFAEPAMVGQRIQNNSTFGQRFPVKAGFWLEQGRDVQFSPILTTRRPKLLSSFAGLFWRQLDAECYKTVFSLVDQLEKNLNLHTLTFPKKKGVWNEVQRFSNSLSKEQRASMADNGRGHPDH